MAYISESHNIVIDENRAILQELSYYACLSDRIPDYSVEQCGWLVRLSLPYEEMDISVHDIGTKADSRRRNASDWKYNNMASYYTFERGYTMHVRESSYSKGAAALNDLLERIPQSGKHMDWFIGLINMNGRVYDAKIGRFLSADLFVQNSLSTQSYNRYSYCLNNPLKYSDPSGWLLSLGTTSNIGNEFAASNAREFKEMYEDVMGMQNYVGWGGYGGAGPGGGPSGQSGFQFDGSHYVRHRIDGSIDPGLYGIIHSVGEGANTHYVNGYGDEVPFKEVMDNYVGPHTINAVVTELFYMGRGSYYNNSKSIISDPAGNLDIYESVEYISKFTIPEETTKNLLEVMTDALSAAGIVADASHEYLNAVDVSRIVYTDIFGSTKWIGTNKVSTAFKVGGKIAIGGGLAVDIIQTLNGNESPAKLTLNLAIDFISYVTMPEVGITVGVGYLVLDKTFGFNGGTAPQGMNGIPPSIAMPDATILTGPRIRH